MKKTKSSKNRKTTTLTIDPARRMAADYFLGRGVRISNSDDASLLLETLVEGLASFIVSTTENSDSSIQAGIFTACVSDLGKYLNIDSVINVVDVSGNGEKGAAAN